MNKKLFRKKSETLLKEIFKSNFKTYKEQLTKGKFQDFIKVVKSRKD